MAVFKIFPEKDAFITSQSPTANAGLDEILELGAFPNIAGQGQSSRILIKFSDQDLTKVLTLVSGSNFEAKLKIYLAEAFEIPTSYTVTASPIYLESSQDWAQGVGKAGDIPVNQSGVSWEYINDIQNNTKWPTALPTGVTSSFEGIVGGGTWYTGSLEGSQEHLVDSLHDLDIDVTQAISAIENEVVTNNGFILKLDDSLDFNTGFPINLRYFSKDTNTIYPPVLEILWDDSIYTTTLPLLETDLATIRVSNGKEKYKVGTKQRFRLAVRPKFPQRQFSTTSIFTQNFRLPENSYWALKDEYTEELLIDYSLIGTKISADTKSSYFDIYMDGLQPERYYRVLVKTEVEGSEVIIPLEEPFKVVRNG
jgi:hypothetical protein